MPVSKRCRRCGRSMRRDSSNDFCQQCLSRYSADEWEAWQNWQKPTCDYCGNLIEWATPCHAGRTRYCSHRCHALADIKIPESAWPEIVRLYRDENLTAKQIGHRYDCTAVTILKILRPAGVLRYGSPGERNGMYGQTHAPEARAKIRAANSRQFSDPKARQRHAELTAKQIQDGRTGKSYNKLETLFAGLLDELSISYQWQARIGRFVFDFLVYSSNTLIEVHGTFWHADPRFYDHAHLRPAQARNVANDVNKEAAALAKGFRFAKFWEHDIHSDPEHTKQQLQALK